VKRAALILSMGLIALVVFLWRFPASAALSFLPKNEVTKNWVKLHELRGTLWAGSARFTVNGIPATQTLSWSCAPSVFSLTIECALGNAITGRIAIQPLSRTLIASDLETTQSLQWSGVANSAFSSDIATIKVSSATFSPKLAQVTANAIAKGVDTRTGNAALSWGEVSLDCAPIDQSAVSKCALRNRASDNRLDGNIDISATRASGNVTITPSGASPQRIAF
jgi:hypothetical protein